MNLLFTVLVVLVVGAIAVVAAGRGDSMVEAEPDRFGSGLPEGRLSGQELRGVRFSTALRGYRASEVDALVERLARELDEAREESAPGPARAPYEAPPEV